MTMLHGVIAIILIAGIVLYKNTLLFAMLFGLWIVWSRGGFEWLL
jgi:hypothetical protein